MLRDGDELISLQDGMCTVQDGAMRGWPLSQLWAWGSSVVGVDTFRACMAGIKHIPLQLHSENCQHDRHTMCSVHDHVL